MKIVVVYESMFGNTEEIARAIAEGLGDAGRVTFGSVDEISVDEMHDVGFLVAGGPTHGHGMARRNARRQVIAMDAKRKYRPVVPGEESLRNWLERISPGKTLAATFDTRFHKPRWLTGSAAKRIARQLGAKGYTVTETQSFFVDHTDGPLEPGERDRAVAWGRALAATARTAAAA